MGKRRITNESFIKKAELIHGVGVYDYSKTEYIKAHKKIIIICPTHGSFEMTPANHTSSKQGCRSCSIIKKAHNRTHTIDEFIKKAESIHGIGVYDYSKTKYINSYTKISIGCLKHGEFLKTPNAHTSLKQGCPKCTPLPPQSMPMTTKDYIKKAIKIHGNIFDYSLVEYTLSHNNVKIICPIHGEFTQTACNHINSISGCPVCNSVGELRIKTWLQRHNIEYKQQQTFEGCINKISLRFDFYIPQFNTCIEYDGLHHARNIKSIFSGGPEYTILRDQIKNKHCIDNDIKLIRIPHTKYKEIDDILTDNFLN